MNLFRAFIELDEAYSNRQNMIDDIKKSGKNYNFAKYSDAQLYRIWQRIGHRPPANKPIAKKEPEHELDLDFESNFDRYCDCGARLSDGGFCPICHDGEEDLDEGIFDVEPPRRSSWVTSTGQQVKLPGSASTAQSVTSTNSSQNTTQSNTPGKYVVVIVDYKGRLRAIATDGTNPTAFVAFPNDLRQFEGQKYEVDQLIWNGKNYRVAGNIVEI